MPKPKTKTAAEARKSHLAIQARRDALVKMRAGETVRIHLVGGIVVQARALGEDEEPAHKTVLALLNRRLRSVWCIDKDTGSRYRITDGASDRILSRKEILGVVLKEML